MEWGPTTVQLSTSLCSPTEQVSALRYAWRDWPCDFKACPIYSASKILPAPPFTSQSNQWTVRRANNEQSAFIQVNISWSLNEVELGKWMTLNRMIETVKVRIWKQYDTIVDCYWEKLNLFYILVFFLQISRIILEGRRFFLNDLWLDNYF